MQSPVVKTGRFLFSSDWTEKLTITTDDDGRPSVPAEPRLADRRAWGA